MPVGVPASVGLLRRFADHVMGRPQDDPTRRMPPIKTSRRRAWRALLSALAGGGLTAAGLGGPLTGGALGAGLPRSSPCPPRARRVRRALKPRKPRPNSRPTRPPRRLPRRLLLTHLDGPGSRRQRSALELGWSLRHPLGGAAAQAEEHSQPRRSARHAPRGPSRSRVRRSPPARRRRRPPAPTTSRSHRSWWPVRPGRCRCSSRSRPLPPRRSRSSASPCSCSPSTRRPPRSTACRGRFSRRSTKSRATSETTSRSQPRAPWVDAVHARDLAVLRRGRPQRGLRGSRTTPWTRSSRRRAICGRPGAQQNLRGAILAYNHSEEYANSVLLRAKLISAYPASVVATAHRPGRRSPAADRQGSALRLAVLGGASVALERDRQRRRDRSGSEWRAGPNRRGRRGRAPDPGRRRAEGDAPRPRPAPRRRRRRRRRAHAATGYRTVGKGSQLVELLSAPNAAVVAVQDGQIVKLGRLPHAWQVRGPARHLRRRVHLRRTRQHRPQLQPAEDVARAGHRARWPRPARRKSRRLRSRRARAAQPP